MATTINYLLDYCHQLMLNNCFNHVIASPIRLYYFLFRHGSATDDDYDLEHGRKARRSHSADSELEAEEAIRYLRAASKRAQLDRWGGG